jgi:hypothetical protein
VESINKLLGGNTTATFHLGQSVEQVTCAAADPEVISGLFTWGGEDLVSESAEEVRVEEGRGRREEGEGLGLEEGREGLEEDGGPGLGRGPRERRHRGEEEAEERESRRRRNRAVPGGGAGGEGGGVGGRGGEQVAEQRQPLLHGRLAEGSEWVPALQFEPRNE